MHFLCLVFGAIRDYLPPIRHLSLGRHSQELRRNNVLLRSSNNLFISLAGARTFLWPNLLVQRGVFLLSVMDVSVFGDFPCHLYYSVCHLLGHSSPSCFLPQYPQIRLYVLSSPQFCVFVQSLLNLVWVSYFPCSAR